VIVAARAAALLQHGKDIGRKVRGVDGRNGNEDEESVLLQVKIRPSLLIIV
jgi:hypothetical protein